MNHNRIAYEIFTYGFNSLRIDWKKFVMSSVELGDETMRKRAVPKTCSHCYDILKENDSFEYKGFYYHNDQLICIGNLKVKVEFLRNILIEINSQTNNIP